MKKIALICSMLAITLFGFCQEKFIRTGGTKGDKFYVGSLPISYVGSYHKLQIKIFGGGYINTSLGTKTYSISTRDGLRILCSQEGGNTGQYTLKIYKTDKQYDFVIETIWDYASLTVQASLTPTSNVGITELAKVDISPYNSEGKEDVTNQFTQVFMPASDVNGRLGIGTLEPLATLDVRGKIIANEVEIKVNKGADHVFSQDYNLLPLLEVESFIKENKHLPEIPSEKQMIDEGLNINEMQIKLLQKIEELTLYVISLKKENNNIRHELEVLKQENK